MAEGVFDVDRAADLPASVSGAYVGLLEHINTKYPAVTPEVRQLLFAVAYSLYCREKKNSIVQHRANGAVARSAVLKTCHVPLTTKASYDRFCDDAREIVNEAIGQSSTLTLTTLVSEIQEVIEKSDKLTLRSVGRDVLRHLIVVVLVTTVIITLAVFIGNWRSVLVGFLIATHVIEAPSSSTSELNSLSGTHPQSSALAVSGPSAAMHAKP